MALFGAAAALLLFAGCSGGGGTNPLPDPVGSVTQPVPATTSNDNPVTRTTASTVSTAQSYLLVKGYIDEVSSTGFHINAGSGIGYIWVYTNSSTHKSYGGLSPKAGEYAVATGTGSYATSITAVYAGLYTSAVSATTISGELTSSQPYGFAIRLSDGKYVPLAMNTSTTVSGNTALWAPVSSYAIGSEGTGYAALSLTGSGGTSTAPTAAPTTTTTTTSSTTRHVLTSDYLQGLYGTTSVTPAQAAPYLSWAQTSVADSLGIHNAGIKTQVYIDPNWLASTDPLYPGTTESDFSHTCSGSRVTVSFGTSSSRYDTYPNSSTMRSHFASWVSAQKTLGWIDMLFEDNGGPFSGYAKYPNGMPCNYSSSNWISYAEGMNNSVSVPIIMNGLNEFSSTTAPDLTIVQQSSNTEGGNMEGCYNDLSDPIDTGTSWQVEENTEIALARSGKYFECMGRDQASAASEYAARIFSYASFLLSYSPSRSVFASEWYTPSKFHVLPETGLVALNPLVSEPSSISGLKQSSGAYGRQYGACYYRGTYVGACAVAVTHDYGATEPFPFSGYTRTLTLSGYGVLDGGTASTNGPPPPSYMAPYTAVIAFK